MPKPVGPGGLPLPRPDNAVTWAITDDNQPIADGVKDEGGPLQIFNYADYIDPAPGQAVREAHRTQGARSRPTTRPTRRSRSSSSGDGRVRRDHGPLGVVDPQPDRAAAASSRSTTRTCRTSRRTSGRRCRIRSTTAARRYTVPYVVWSDGIGYRNDKIDEDIPELDVPYDIFWESAGLPREGRRSSTTTATRSRMPMQRDAIRERPIADLNTEDPKDRRARPARTSTQLIDICNIKVDDHRLPDAARGQDVAPPVVVGRPARRRVLLHAEGRAAERPLATGGRRRTASSRTTSSASAGRRRTPRSHTGSSTSCSTRRSPTTTSSTTSATRRRRTRSTAERLIAEGLIPKTLADAVVRPEQFAANQQLLELTVEGQRALGRGLVEVQGG